MKKTLIYTFLLLTVSVFGQNQSLFQDANEAYTKGNYEKAVEKYQQIIANGEASAEVYYNLGNAHYKLNHIAPSIYNYEKALQLKPKDEDIQNNLQFARNMTIDDIPENEKTGFSKTINGLISTFSFDTWAAFAVIGSVLFVVLFLLYYFSGRTLAKRLFFAGAAFAFLCTVACVFFAYEQQDIQQNNKYAIIFSEEAEVRSEPTMRGDEAFVLHEGTRAKVLEDYQGWVKIELADGTQGWTQKDNLREL